jgi:hypothetical protein
MTATMTLFNDNGTCATADILGTYILGQGQVIFFSQLGKQFGTALSYTLSAAVATGGPVIIGASQ